MTTITEDYVSFETAKLLKEKGFPQDPNICNNAYTFRGKFSNNVKSFAHNFTEFNKFGIKPLTYSIAPTLQMAMKWLREVHNLQIIIIPIRTKQHKNWTFEMYKEFNLLNIDVSCFSTYEEACEAAIKYCLEILI